MCPTFLKFTFLCQFLPFMGAFRMLYIVGLCTCFSQTIEEQSAGAFSGLYSIVDIF